MRRLLIALVAASVLLIPAPKGAAAADARPRVDVVEVSGLIDPVVADFIRRSIRQAAKDDASVLVLQLNTSGGVLSGSQAARLANEIHNSDVPVAVWVGPSGAKAKGTGLRLVRAAAVAGTSTNTHIGEATGRTALEFGIVTVNAPTLGDFVIGLDGRPAGTTTLQVPSTVINRPGRPPQRRPDVDVQLAKLDILGRLLHTAASPSVAYLLLVTGLLLVIFEFFTAGVGVAAAVAAGFLGLAAYGLDVLPIRPWALVLLILAMAGYAIDVQSGVPRFWAAVGTAALVVGTLFLYHGLRLSPLAMIVGVGGTALMMVAGMPAVIRSRFATPTVGRESMVGELGTAIIDVKPDGTVEVRGAQWRARTNRATPITAGDAIRVVGIDGLLLEVEPEAGGARDYRH